MTDNTEQRPGRKAARTALAAVALGLAAIGTTPVSAQTLPEGLSGSVSIYNWLPAMEGTASVPGSGISTDFSAGIDDIIKSFNFGVFGAAELRYGRWGLINDLFHSNLGSSSTLGGPFGTVVKNRTALTMVTLALGYRVYETDTAFFDVYAGGRYTNSALTLTSTRTIPAPVSRRATGEASWLDPLVGVRAGVALSDRWSATAMVDFAGFGVGSELTWQAIAGVSYAITPAITADLGLRYMSIDRDGARVDVDIQMFGPTAGIPFRF